MLAAAMNPFRAAGSAIRITTFACGLSWAALSWRAFLPRPLLDPDRHS